MIMTNDRQRHTGTESRQGELMVDAAGCGEGVSEAWRRNT
jgi:hypothetical protein